MTRRRELLDRYLDLEDGPERVQARAHLDAMDRELDSLQADGQLPASQQLQADDKTPLRPSQRIRITVQQISSVLWQDDPTLPIAEMVKQEAIQKLGGASYYVDDTVAEWLRAVAPEEAIRKPGRPRKKSG